MGSTGSTGHQYFFFAVKKVTNIEIFYHKKFVGLEVGVPHGLEVGVPLGLEVGVPPGLEVGVPPGLAASVVLCVVVVVVIVCTVVCTSGGVADSGK